jgi:hypothetical protein
MDNVEYTLRISAFTPDTIPMARLAEYMAELAKIVGFEKSAHFDRVEKGSAVLVARIDPPEAPKVNARLNAIANGDATAAVTKALSVIDDMLAEDNSEGDLRGPSGAVMIPFPGITRPRPLAFPGIRQDGSIDGEVVSVGGKDKTSHVILQDGPISYSNIEMPRELAKQLGKLLYGPKVRLFGRGRWERCPDATWRLLKFAVDKFEVLDDSPLSQVLDGLRQAAPEGFRSSSIYHDLMDLRLGEDEVH